MSALRIRLATRADLDVLLATTGAAFEETRALGLPSSALDEDASTWAPLLGPEDGAQTTGGAAMLVNADVDANANANANAIAIANASANGTGHDEERVLGSIRFHFDRAVEPSDLHQAAAALPGFARDQPAKVHSVRFERLAVVPSARGRGFGVHLVRWVVALATELGAREVLADARSQRPDSRGFYTRLGFEIVGASDCYGIPDLRTHLRLPLR